MAIDKKYGQIDIKGIPADEPVFVLRAKDRLSAPAIQAYAEMAQDAGCTPEFVESAQSAGDTLASWPTKKLPD